MEHHEGGLEGALPRGSGWLRSAHDGKMIRPRRAASRLHTGFTCRSSAPHVGDFAP